MERAPGIEAIWIGFGNAGKLANSAIGHVNQIAQFSGLRKRRLGLSIVTMV